jgi:hypothetical protein
MTKEEIEKIDMYDLLTGLKKRTFGKASEFAWDELFKRIGKLNDIKRIAICRKALGLLSDDEIISLQTYLMDSVNNDNGTVYNSIASYAAAGNEMGLKAMEIRRKILEAK